MMNNEDFGKFYVKYYKISFEAAYRMVKNRGLAEDLCQEVFARFYEHMEEIDTENERKLESFVRTVTINHTKDYFKKAHVKREIAVPEKTPCGRGKVPENSVEAAILSMEENEYMKLILQRLRDINPMNYEILIKVKYLDIPPSEVAKEFGITRNNVNNRILRTKRWMEAELSRMYDQ